MTGATTIARPSDRPGSLLTVEIWAVGGQRLPLVTRQLARRWVPMGLPFRIQESYGMAQKGGIVSASIELELPDDATRRSSAARVLLGLERIEGARRLVRLQAGDVAFIATGAVVPPGAPRHSHPAPIPSLIDLERTAEDLGVRLVIVDAAVSSPWAVSEAAIADGAVP